MSSVSIKVFRGKEGFYEIKNDWDRIVDTIHHKHLFHSYQWYKSYIETIKDADFNGIFIVMYRDRIPFALFPVELCAIGDRDIDNLIDFIYLSDGKNEVGNAILGLVFLTKCLKLFGFKLRLLQIPHCLHCDYGDFVYAKQEINENILGLLVNCLKEEYNWDFFILPNVTEDSSISHFLKNSNYSLVVSEKIEESFYLNCESYEEIHKNLSKKFRAELRLKRNRIARQDKVEFLSIRTKKDLNWAFQDFIDVEGGGWKGEQGTAIKSDSEIKKFFENIVFNFSDDRKCEINLLKVNDKSIAGQLCLLTDDTVYLIKVGYDEKYLHLSPGLILFDELIKRCSSDGSVRKINMCSASKEYARWKPSLNNVSNIIIFNNSILGFIYYMYFKYILQFNVYSKYIRPIIHKCKLIVKSIKKR